MQKTIANILLAATGFACFLALNSFSLWGFALLPETALGENAQLLWSAPLSLSNMLTFFVFVIGHTALRRCSIAARYQPPPRC